MERTYIAIDLKSFYASVECRERDLDPLTTNLVVADASRTQKTICLAVSPSLKAYGIPGRPRLFEVEAKVRQVNADHPNLHLDYIVAPPRMALYMQYSTEIYNIYLRYVAPEDIHVYSIDEVFMDVTGYLNTYNMSPKELARKMILEVLRETGITATAGIGTNLYLCKIAMDVEAKHIEPDANGVRIAQLDEQSYRKQLWTHTPITDFWRVGTGYAKKLAKVGLFTMGDVAMCSLGGDRDYYNENLLYQMFGVNAELLIDHAWGWEPCTMEEIKAYKPTESSIGSGQVLQCPYSWEKAKLIVREMTEVLILNLVDQKLVTDQLVLTVGYDIENLKDKKRSERYKGDVTIDRYGRRIPKHAHGTVNLEHKTSSTKVILDAVMDLYDRITNPELLVRRINIAANKVMDEKKAKETESFEQLDLFTDYKAKEKEEQRQKKERKMQEAMLQIQKKYGKNAILKCNDLKEGAMTKERNAQIGGHKA